jgi:VWFA-related protein
VRGQVMSCPEMGRPEMGPLNMNRHFALVVALLLAPLSAIQAQNTAAPPPAQSEPTLSTKAPSVTTRPATDRRVTLDVQVTDKSGALIRGLQEQDFALLDDKQPQKIVSFQAVDASAAATSDPPIEVIMVVDAINTTFHSVAYERDEVKKFLLQNGGKLAWPVRFVMFSEAGTKIQSGSSRDGNALAALYDQYQLGLRSANRSRSGGFYGATDRIDMSLKALMSIVELEKTRPGRKLMIWFSRGWPMLSDTRSPLTSKGAQQTFNWVVSASTELRQARITLYSVDPIGLANAGQLRSTYYEDFLRGVKSPSKVLPGNLGLPVLAVQSGGRVFNTSNDLETAVEDCVADASAYYILSFDSLPADQQDEYHALQVTVDKPGMTVRTRTGYYDQR